MKAWLKHAQPVVLAAAIAAAFTACDEQLDAGLACPALCPQQVTVVLDTTLLAVELDTSVSGFPSIGSELGLFVASFGDTLQTRAVMRFDTLPVTFRHNNTATDSNIVFVDTGAVFRFRIVTGDTLGLPTTVEAYDVALGGPDDSDPTAVASAFTADRLLGSRTFAAAQLKDSIDVPIDPGKLLAKIQTQSPTNRLRVGIRVTSSGTAKLTIIATNGASARSVSPPQLLFRPAADTSVPIAIVTPRSLTPAEPLIANDLADYLVVTKAPPAPPNTVLRVGGLPGRRTYLRFNIPSRILDSSNVVRATLLLTQSPNSFTTGPRDSVAIEQWIVTAGPTVNDLSRALLFLTSPPRSDSVRLAPADSGVRSFEMITALRTFWRSTTSTKTPRAIALRTSTEGASGRAVDFFSVEAPDAVKPRLRITYLPRSEGGLP